MDMKLIDIPGILKYKLDLNTMRVVSFQKSQPYFMKWQRKYNTKMKMYEPDSDYIVRLLDAPNYKVYFSMSQAKTLREQYLEAHKEKEMYVFSREVSATRQIPIGGWLLANGPHEKMNELSNKYIGEKIICFKKVSEIKTELCTSSKNTI